MTNNIKKIKNSLLERDKIRDAEIAYLNGNTAIAQKILDDYLKSLIEYEKENAYQSEEHVLCKEKIIATYKYLGLTIPEL